MKTKTKDCGLRKYIFLGLMCFAFFAARAQYETIVDVSNCPDAAVEQAIEQNGTKLLTEFNNAQGEKRNLSLSGINIAKDAASSLLTMWEVCPFRCDELEIIESCLRRNDGGYQVRNIPVIMEPRAGERFEEDKYQEIVLNYDAQGAIADVCFTISSAQYKQIMRSNLEVTDLRRRSLVIDFVEQFRTAYNRKDMAFLEDIFSDDALIITGKTIQRKPVDGIAMPPEVVLTSQTKRKYLTKLAGVFKRNQRINVVFEDVKVSTHRSKTNIYGVKLIQHWNADTYSDKGYLFLLWDFADETHPQIHVRAWQPFESTPKDKVLGLGSFKIAD